MIKSVHLKNFQSHKDTLLEFPDGINSLTGSSNSGKTAVLRAIGWVLHNKPSGDSFISYWARDAKGKQKDDCSVTITFADGTTVERIRSKTENIYKLNGQSFEAIGQSVPKEIADACNVSEVNFQTQMEAPFLLSESAGEVARFFNKIVKLDSIDVYLTAIESKKRKTKVEKETVKDNLERVTKELDEFTWLDKAEKLIAKVEKYETKLEEIEEKKNNLAQGFAVIEKMQEVLERTGIVDRAEELVSDALTVLPSIQGIKDKAKQLSGSIEQFKKHKTLLDSIPDTEKAEKLCTKGIKFAGMLAEGQAEQDKLVESIGAYAMYNKVIEDADKEHKELHDMLPDTCPACGAKL